MRASGRTGAGGGQLGHPGDLAAVWAGRLLHEPLDR